MTEREQFLKNEWQPYPEAPAQCNFYGRVSDFQNRATLPEKFQKILDPSDWIAARLSTNENTIENKVIEVVQELYLLAPALEVTASFDLRVWQNHQTFQKFLDLVREFFSTAGFQQVATPTLVICPGTEPTLDVFSTEQVYGKKKKRFYLPTSPELHLKKIMSQVGAPIFEIRSCFRNNEIGDHHQPEFCMLEFYRPFCGLEIIQKDIKDLVEFLVLKLKTPQRPANYLKASMADLFEKYINFKLQPNTSRSELLNLCQRRNLHVPEDSTWDDLFFLLFLEFIEPKLSPEDLLFVADYPPGQAALARLNKEGWGDRFEFYWRGLELGNAFHELNNPQVQLLRFQEDMEKKAKLGKEVLPIDEDFLASLRAGMPPSAGIAVGLDRLFMALMGLQKLEDFYLFPMRAL